MFELAYHYKALLRVLKPLIEQNSLIGNTTLCIGSMSVGDWPHSSKGEKEFQVWS